MWKFLLLFVIYLETAYSFGEDAIFEEEDIYNQALPPVPHTGITAPGTKWCGPDNDLGSQHETDTCCRAHDHCEDIIEAQSTLHDLHNPDWFPILKCSCEQTFLNCLQKANTMVSNTMGRVYFGTRSKCFDFGHPVLSCKEYQSGTFRKRCIRYNIDKTREKQWQFYDIPFYTLSSRRDELRH